MESIGGAPRDIGVGGENIGERGDIATRDIGVGGGDIGVGGDIAPRDMGWEGEVLVGLD